MGNDMGQVIIKCFQTPTRKYFYDRFLNSVVAVNDQEYELLKEVEKSRRLLAGEYLRRFTDNGLLQETILEKIEHPETSNLKYLSEHHMENLILQVTQQCNLRCRYCAYSGNYYNRIHTSQRMSYYTAKEAIDFYLDRSDEASSLCLSFYGGEPLLEFELIKKCVSYIIKRKGDQPIRFPMTTNGTLLTREKIEFLVENAFSIMISLDGTKESHDANRCFTTGEGSFDLVMKNLKLLKAYDKKYYEKNVMFNCVISTTTNLDSTYEFFANSELFYPHAVHFNFVDSVDIRDESIAQITQENGRAAKFEYLRMLLCIVGRKDWDSKSKILRERASDTELLYEHLHRHAAEGGIMHHGGPCLPGVRRLFVETNGIFFPCERVSENDSQMSIGSLKQGFDYNKMDFYLNHGKLTEKECIDCWNLRECNFCLGGIEKQNQEITKEKLIKKCRNSKQRTETLLCRLCILAELGYQGHDDLKIFR